MPEFDEIGGGTFTATPEQKPEQKNPEDDKTVLRLYNFAKANIRKLVVSDSDSSMVYALVQINNHVESVDVRSYRAISWLQYKYYTDKNRIETQEQCEAALKLLAAKAIHEHHEREAIYNRIAMVNDSIIYDLTTTDWQAVKIVKGDWAFVPLDENTPIFARMQPQQKHVTPKPTNEDILEKLCELLRIQRKDRFVFKVHLVSFFLEKYPMPIMVFTGEQGSIKTTITQTIKRIVDPSIQKSSSIPRKGDDLAIHMYNRYLSAFDNVSGFDHEVSDTFCRVITGEGISKRMLYKDTQEVILTYVRKIVMNGISPSMEFPDFRDRTIFYETMPVEEKDRLTLEEFNTSIDEIMPELMGQIFTTLSRALAIYDDTKQSLDRLPRMSDFGVWGEAISRSLGHTPNEFLDEYKDRIALISLDVVNNYPLFGMVRDLMETKTEYEGTVSSFYQTMLAMAEQNGVDVRSKASHFPQAANKVKMQISLLRTNFRLIGLECFVYSYERRDGKYRKGSHVIKISKMEGLPQGVGKVSQPSQPSQPEQNQAQNNPNSGRDTGRDTLFSDWVSQPETEKTTPKNEVADVAEMADIDCNTPAGRMTGGVIRISESDDAQKWATPRPLFEYIKTVHNVNPILDVCANEQNHKCDQFYTEEINGLKQSWTQDAWCNPPYRDVGVWIQKCYLEHEKNNITVTALVFSKTDTIWWRDYVQDKAEVIHLKGRVHFLGPDGLPSKDPAPHGSCVIIWRKK